MALRIGWRQMTGKDLIEQQLRINEANAKGWEEPLPRTWGEVFGTISLALELFLCFFSVILGVFGYIIILYDHEGTSPKGLSNEGRDLICDIVGTLYPFYVARCVGVGIDFYFRCWEGLVFAKVERVLDYEGPCFGRMIFDLDYVDDDVKARHRKVLAIKEWVILVGRMVSPVLFFALYKIGWWTRFGLEN
ncbi:uncharacterized protein LY89DRAFT_692236 [Mollisia scopiformis]|uniref:Uncharacterized protein n=1 Tax=Mollisia scopiformis TaxID=149040 RepID=A0A132B3Q7_MOLSC|nr:uncharacterized protein LY89DRAFT_692236 [Mollisia scopiformis]KUJ06883.1 hypothetical protein LY89DRAFT_692236 [Mollisia scopiformis]